MLYLHMTIIYMYQTIHYLNSRGNEPTADPTSTIEDTGEYIKVVQR